MPQRIPLWPADVNSKIHGEPPTLTPFLLEDGAKAKAIIMLLPGGGYQMLADGYEGEEVAQYFNGHGFHAAVLRYRLAPNRHPGMIHDAQRGLRMIRARAAEWKIDANQVGILGFSAGGHLSSTAAVHFDRFTAPHDELASRFSARPDAAVLCYPVVDMGEYAHVGSRNNLLGENADPHLVDLLSNHKHVTPRTPPSFIWHTADDEGVPMENALLFAGACRKQGVPAELHVYASGRHGLGLATNDAPAVATWGPMCATFLKKYLQK